MVALMTDQYVHMHGVWQICCATYVRWLQYMLAYCGYLKFWSVLNAKGCTCT